MKPAHEVNPPALLRSTDVVAVVELLDADLEAVAAGKSPNQGGDRTLTGAIWTGLGRSPGVASNAAGNADSKLGGKMR